MTATAEHHLLNLQTAIHRTCHVRAVQCRGLRVLAGRLLLMTMQLIPCPRATWYAFSFTRHYWRTNQHARFYPVQKRMGFYSSLRIIQWLLHAVCMVAFLVGHIPWYPGSLIISHIIATLVLTLLSIDKRIQIAYIPLLTIASVIVLSICCGSWWHFGLSFTSLVDTASSSLWCTGRQPIKSILSSDTSGNRPYR